MENVYREKLCLGFVMQLIVTQVFLTVFLICLKQSLALKVLPPRVITDNLPLLLKYCLPFSWQAQNRWELVMGTWDFRRFSEKQGVTACLKNCMAHHEFNWGNFGHFKEFKKRVNAHCVKTKRGSLVFSNVPENLGFCYYKM